MPAADILNGRESENFTKLMAFQIERARGFYDQALAALPQDDRRNQRAGLVMAAIYRTLLEEIAPDAGNVLTTRTSLTPIRKLWIAARTWIKA